MFGMTHKINTVFLSRQIQPTVDYRLSTQIVLRVVATTSIATTTTGTTAAATATATAITPIAIAVTDVW